MPPRIPPIPSPRPVRPGWQDHEDWIDDLKDGPKPKPPPADGDPIPAKLDDADPHTCDGEE